MKLREFQGHSHNAKNKLISKEPSGGPFTLPLSMLKGHYICTMLLLHHYCYYYLIATII